MYKTLLFLLGAFLFFQNCTTSPCHCLIDKDVECTNDSIINEMFFDQRNGIYNYWSRFREPVLPFQTNESYRFTVHTSNHYQKIYRVEQSGSRYILYVNEYATLIRSHQQFDSLVMTFSREITPSVWDSIKSAIEENCFWTMPLDQERNHRLLDGSDWILEGFNPNGNRCTGANYHGVSRVSPGSSSFTHICDQFIALDSLNFRSFYQE